MKKYLYTLLMIPFVVFSQDYELGTYQLDSLTTNSNYSDFGTSYFGKDKVVFSAPKSKGLFTKKWKENGQPFLELYVGDLLEKGQIANVKKFGGDGNSKYHEAQITFTKDGRTAYFTSNNYLAKKYVKGEDGYNNLQIFRADVTSTGSLKNIELLPFNNKNYSFGHPCLTANDTELYFVSDMPGGKGGTDIYKVKILSKGKFSKPVNLGDKINTIHKEMFPFVKSDTILYYASNRPFGKGGLDIYANDIRNGEFQKTLHLPKPVNSSKDDFAYVFADNGYGFVSSNRSGGKGDDDIYAVEIIDPLQLKICQQTLIGFVEEGLSKKPLAEASVYLFNKENVLLDSVISDTLGKFSIAKTISCESSYYLKASKLKHKGDSISIVTAKEFNKVNEVLLSLESKAFVKNETGQIVIKIDPIYFDSNKYAIRTDAALVLDKVIAVMNEYPTMVVEGGSHTDTRGSARYNEKLSARRAKSTVDYILSKGIPSDRISSKGYGETAPINHCLNGVRCSKEDHALNRRTEFRIISY
ncbi:OmpA family protein [Flavobacteriaceae bacterium]|nr:OmpA family protein [Flavobacteriaceae bacterium]